eukprot:1137860-Prymnesium_polylepis.2
MRHPEHVDCGGEGAGTHAPAAARDCPRLAGDAVKLREGCRPDSSHRLLWTMGASVRRSRHPSIHTWHPSVEARTPPRARAARVCLLCGPIRAKRRRRARAAVSPGALPARSSTRYCSPPTRLPSMMPRRRSPSSRCYSHRPPSRVAPCFPQHERASHRVRRQGSRRRAW